MNKQVKKANNFSITLALLVASLVCAGSVAASDWERGSNGEWIKYTSAGKITCDKDVNTCSINRNL